MTWSDEDERELRHIAAMIEALCRLDVGERSAATSAVMQPAYWRARVEAIRCKHKHPSRDRVAILTTTLLERLDKLDALQRGHDGTQAADAR